MSEAKKESLFAKLFGPKKSSCCCNLRIEEVPEAESKTAEGKPVQQTPCCGAGQPNPTAGGGKTNGSKAGGHGG